MRNRVEQFQVRHLACCISELDDVREIRALGGGDHDEPGFGNFPRKLDVVHRALVADEASDPQERSCGLRRRSRSARNFDEARNVDDRVRTRKSLSRQLELLLRLHDDRVSEPDAQPIEQLTVVTLCHRLERELVVVGGREDERAAMQRAIERRDSEHRARGSEDDGTRVGGLERAPDPRGFAEPAAAPIADVRRPVDEAEPIAREGNEVLRSMDDVGDAASSLGERARKQHHLPLGASCTPARAVIETRRHRRRCVDGDVVPRGSGHQRPSVARA